MAATNGMIDTDDAVILLIDHQSGLFNTVRDVPVPDLRNYVTAIAKVATLFKYPGDHRPCSLTVPMARSSRKFTNMPPMPCMFTHRAD